MRQLRLNWDEDSFEAWADAFDVVKGERALMVGVIQRAALDYLRGMRQEEKAEQIRLDGELDERYSESDWDSAFEFLFSPSIQPWSFKWILNWLSDDPDGLHEAFHKALRQRVQAGGHVLKHIAHCRRSKGRYGRKIG